LRGLRLWMHELRWLLVGVVTRRDHEFWLPIVVCRHMNLGTSRLVLIGSVRLLLLLANTKIRWLPLRVGQQLCWMIMRWRAGSRSFGEDLVMRSMRIRVSRR
jgi:hypothetical protein